MTENSGPDTRKDEDKRANADLARRLARFRARVEAEGRKRSVDVIDRAIRETRKKVRD